MVAPEAGRSMRVTVCELPHEPEAMALAWGALSVHTRRHASQLVLLPELVGVDPVWQDDEFDAERWAAAQQLSDAWLARLGELGAEHVVGTRPVTVDGWRLNQGYLWSAARGVIPLRGKFFLPNEPDSWEARWFDRGDPEFPSFRAGALTFGLNICTELWAVETYAPYAAHGVQAILAPRATS
jgi:N-carbamoylputrescine amidase